MATTAQDVFDRAIALMDAADESSEYRDRALFIINTLQGELFRYSDTYAATSGVRPVCPEISRYDVTLEIDDFLARTILPYGLAYHLLAIDGDSTGASLYLQRYQELIALQGGAVPTVSADIENIYGGLRNGSDN